MDDVWAHLFGIFGLKLLALWVSAWSFGLEHPGFVPGGLANVAMSWWGLGALVCLRKVLLIGVYVYFSGGGGLLLPFLCLSTSNNKRVPHHLKYAFCLTKCLKPGNVENVEGPPTKEVLELGNGQKFKPCSKLYGYYLFWREKHKSA